MNSNFVIFVPIAIVVFILLREVFTWYWKLNKISNLLEKIESNTRPKTSIKTKEEEKDSSYTISKN